MSNFETPCLCLARDALQHEPVHYRWFGVDTGDGTLWAAWPECPTHPGEYFISPVWAQRVGRLDYDEAASGELAATLEANL